jgi:hypothetical protein
MTIKRNHNRGEDIMNNPYADIIDLPHHVSKRHPQMPMEKRAAQFSPFAAVSGHDEAIHETAMLTEDKLELYEDEMNAIDEKLRLLQYHIKEQLKVTVAYFKPDEAKNGGAYVTVTGSAKKVDDVSKMLLLQDGKVIPIKDIQMLQNLSR